MWIVEARRTAKRYIAVRLFEGRKLDNGAIICTGRRTPGYSFSLTTGNLASLAEQMRRSLKILTAESALAPGEELQLVAATVAEELGGVLTGEIDPADLEVDDGKVSRGS